MFLFIWQKAGTVCWRSRGCVTVLTTELGRRMVEQEPGASEHGSCIVWQEHPQATLHFLENRCERWGLGEARPAGLSIRIRAFFSSSPQICRVKHLQQWISSNPYSRVVGNHRSGEANSKYVLRDEIPTHFGQVCQSTSPGSLAGILALTAQRAVQTFLWWF